MHRDLKPDNIMIARDDYAKILDFGLAKLIEGQRSSGFGSETSSEVATAVMPQHSLPGTVLGTVGYMSPEQAQGRVNEIDHRSDIFSFGCILFEAATGNTAFEGKVALDSLHKIVHARHRKSKTSTLTCLTICRESCAGVWQKSPTNVISRSRMSRLNWKSFKRS